MIYFRIFTILLATAFMLIVFYGDLSTVTSLLAGLCGGFVAVVAAQNNASLRLKAVETARRGLRGKVDRRDIITPWISGQKPQRLNGRLNLQSARNRCGIERARKSLNG